jgi:uncharacterized membrane protein YecN with MAPEG domain
MKLVLIVENKGHALYIARVFKAFGRKASIKRRRNGKKIEYVVYIS